MYYFCEECGGKIEIEQDNKGRALPAQCRICGEFLHLQSAAADCPTGSPASAERKINIMIVDDSRLMRKAVKQIFDQASFINIAGEAENGAVALELLPRLKPDVITLDINMPVMDGLTALKHIMIQNPTPTVMFSTLTRAGSAAAFQALQYGAVDVMEKPSQVAPSGVNEQFQEIVRKVALAADVSVEAIRYIRNPEGDKPADEFAARPCDQIVTLGAAEGGFGSLLKVIPQLRPDTTAAYLGLVYADGRHVDQFAAYLDKLSQVRVRRAENGAPLNSGECLLAAGGEYVTVERRNNLPVLRVEPAPFASQRGAINMLMFSAVEVFNHRTIGVVLSGMGRDGQEGIREIKRNNGFAFIQDPRTCLYKEMASSILVQPENCTVATDSQLATFINTQTDTAQAVVGQAGYAATAN